MATIVTGTVPSDELALNYTLERLPEMEVECERIVQSGEGSIMPLLWIRYDDREGLEATLEEDPTVDAVEILSEFDGEFLYRMEWIDHVRLLLHMLTNSEATVLDAYGQNRGWHLRMLYPEREHFSRTHEFADEHGLTFEVLTIREMEGEPAGRYGLTDSQHRVLELASRRGYFEVPRDVTLKELAEEIGVSHQALSEQLRRGTGALVEDTICIGTFPEEEDTSPDAKRATRAD
jgi:hypothetical protein